MAISLKKNGEKLDVLIDNSHAEALERIVKKFSGGGIKNEAEALDFAIKALGYNDTPSEGVHVDGMLFVPKEQSA